MYGDSLSSLNTGITNIKALAKESRTLAAC